MGDTNVPLTTVFTESDYCTELFASFVTQDISSVPTVTRSWASDDNNHGACHPYDAGRGPFSPGWYCPAGWETASTETADKSSYMNVYCCPSGYTYDIDCTKTTSEVRVYTTDINLTPFFVTLSAAVAEARPWWLQQPLGATIPPTAAPTGPDDSDDGSDSNSDSNSGEQSDSGSGDQGSTDEDGSGGLSTGAKAGIGVGVAIAVIIVVVVGLLLWLRKRKASKKASTVEFTYGGDARDPGAGAPELEDTGKPGAYEKGATETTETSRASPAPPAPPASHNELSASERNNAPTVPRGEELDSTQTAPKEPEGTELDGVQRMELESQERRLRHELETGMSATVRDVPELMHSAEYYELEGPKTEARSELESTTAPVTSSGEPHLSELQRIEAEEERLRKRREELVAAQQQGK